MQVDDYHLSNPTLKGSLVRDGFCEIKELVDPQRWSNVFACPKVHHGRMLGQVRHGLAILDELCGWTCVLSKFRAGAACGATTKPTEMSRDLTVYGSSVPPIFALVIFVDESTMRLQPKSHVNLRLSLAESLKTRSNSYTFAPGSALLMHATLLHSDIIRGKRAVFCMDLFPSPDVAAVYSPRTLHIRNTLSATTDARAHFVEATIAIAQSVRAARGNRMEMTLPTDVTMISNEHNPRVAPDQIDAFIDCGGYVVLPEAFLRGVDDDENDMLRQDFGSLKVECKACLIYIVAASIVLILLWKALFKTR